jgi:hypothetical protein
MEHVDGLCLGLAHSRSRLRCALCRRWCHADGQWRRIVEAGLLELRTGLISHGYCPKCFDQLMREME